MCCIQDIDELSSFSIPFYIFRRIIQHNTCICHMLTLLCTLLCNMCVYFLEKLYLRTQLCMLQRYSANLMSILWGYDVIILMTSFTTQWLLIQLTGIVIGLFYDNFQKCIFKNNDTKNKYCTNVWSNMFVTMVMIKSKRNVASIVFKPGQFYGT